MPASTSEHLDWQTTDCYAGWPYFLGGALLPLRDIGARIGANDAE